MGQGNLAYKRMRTVEARKKRQSGNTPTFTKAEIAAMSPSKRRLALQSKAQMMDIDEV